MLSHVVKEGAIGCQNVFRGLAKMSCTFLSLTGQISGNVDSHTFVGEQILASVARRMRYFKQQTPPTT
jgi:hypothetical protein